MSFMLRQWGEMIDKQSFIDDPGFAQGSIKEFADPESRPMFVERKIRGRKIYKPPSPSQIWGSRLETYLFTPGKVQQCPHELLTAKGTRSTTGKKWKEFAENGKLVDTHGHCSQGNVWYITPEERRQLDLVTEGIKRHPRIGRILANHHHRHHRMRWIQNGLGRKGEIDFLHTDKDGYDWLFDVKTSAHTGVKAFSDDCYKWGYHIQMADYANGWEANTGEDLEGALIIVIRNCEPYDCELHRISDESMDEGRDFLDVWTRRLCDAITANDWGPTTRENCGVIQRPVGWAGKRWDDERLIGDTV